MAITFSGLATGLDTDSIVTDLMAVERAPIDRLEAKKTAAADRLKAFKQFNTRLDALKSAVSGMSITSALRSTTASLSSEDAFTATTSSGALGSYNISVAQLSQVQKTITDPFASATESILGTGTFTVNGTDINVTADNNSLKGLAESINELSDTTGVKASIINNGASGYHLVLTGQDASTSFDVSSTLEDATADLIDFNFSEVQPAQEAVVFIDGIKVVSQTNTISDAITGVTLNLNSVSATTYSGTPEVDVDPADWADPPVYATDKMDIVAETGAMKEKITTFVTAYNDIMEWILSGYDEFGGTSDAVSETDTENETLLGSTLRGDATINSMKRQLQNMLTGPVNNSGTFKILSEIGISTNLDGTLNQDNTKLDAALADNYDDMVYLLSGDDNTAGVMKGFNSLLLNMTSSSSGMYAAQKTSYTSTAKMIDTQLELMEVRMTKREALMRSQFSAMETLVSTLNATGDFLTQQLDALNGNS